MLVTRTLHRILKKPNVETPMVLLMNDCRDQDNFGAQALIDGLLGILQESIPSSKIRTIPSHWFLDLSYGMDSLVKDGAGMRQPKAIFPTMADQYERFADDWFNGQGGEGAKEYLARLEGIDLVVLNGEGSLYRTNLSAQRELFLAWVAKTKLGIPTMFINGLVHLTDVMPFLPGMVRKTFGALDAVAVREPASYRNLKQYMPQLEAYVFPDSAFYLTPKIAEESSAVKNLRKQIKDQPFFCFDPGAMPVDHKPPYKSALYDLIMTLKQVVPQALLVSSAPADNYIEQIARETDSMYVNTLTRYQEFMALTKDAQFIVSGRYHNPILAALMGCPSITLASTNHKVHGAGETLGGLNGTPYDGTDLRSFLPTIKQHAQRYVDHRAEIGNQLTVKTWKLRGETEGLGQLVRERLMQAAAA